MTNAARRFWGRGDSNDAEASKGEPVDAGGVSPQARGEKTASERSPVAVNDGVGGRDSELLNVGAEVEAVLASARDAAARIRAAAETDASRLREQTTEAANEEIAAAKRAIAEERSEAEQDRSEAEAYAQQTRSSAETVAEETRAEAERQSAELIEAAQARLAEADAEAERQLRELEGTAHERAEQLRAAIERHEARLESMLAVFRGVCSQLEDLLTPGGENLDHDVRDESLEDDLRLNIVQSTED